jgi:hypothetical protein
VGGGDNRLGQGRDPIVPLDRLEGDSAFVDVDQRMRVVVRVLRDDVAMNMRAEMPYDETVDLLRLEQRHEAIEIPSTTWRAWRWATISTCRWLTHASSGP